LVQMILLRLYEVSDVNTQYVPFVTGPGALKNAFIHYMGQQHGDKKGMTAYEQFQRVLAGVYRGATPETNHTTVRVVGEQGNANEYIWREALPGKINVYQVRFHMFALCLLTFACRRCRRRRSRFTRCNKLAHTSLLIGLLTDCFFC
jgi:hypothetical protein